MIRVVTMKPKPLAERRRRLVDLVNRLDEAVPVLFLPDTFASGEQLLAMCAELRLEGIVSKRLDRPYVSGPFARLGQGQVRCLEGGEPLARRGIREGENNRDGPLQSLALRSDVATSPYASMSWLRMA
jgi:hypothetical protein